MTIIEAISRLARHHPRRDFAALTAPEVADAVQALNGGMQELYQLLPPTFRQQVVSVLVPAPRAVSLQATNGTAALGAAVFATDEVGRSVVTSGDTIRHRVAGTDALADAWLGASGTHAATVYGDAVAGAGYPFERIVDAPSLVRDSGGHRVLVPVDPLRHERYLDGLLGGVGEPRAYWLQPMGNAQGAEPIMVLRLCPLPDRAYRLRYTASFGPRLLRYADVDAGGPLPVPDNYAPALLALATTHLATMPGWAVPPSAASAARSLAMDFIHGARVPLSPAVNAVGTPAGF